MCEKTSELWRPARPSPDDDLRTFAWAFWRGKKHAFLDCDAAAGRFEYETFAITKRDFDGAFMKKNRMRLGMDMETQGEGFGPLQTRRRSGLEPILAHQPATVMRKTQFPLMHESEFRNIAIVRKREDVAGVGAAPDRHALSLVRK